MTLHDQSTQYKQQIIKTDLFLCSSAKVNFPCAKQLVKKFNFTWLIEFQNDLSHTFVYIT